MCDNTLTSIRDLSMPDSEVGGSPRLFWAVSQQLYNGVEQWQTIEILVT